MTNLWIFIIQFFQKFLIEFNGPLPYIFTRYCKNTPKRNGAEIFSWKMVLKPFSKRAYLTWN